MPFEFDSSLAWMLFVVLMIAIGGSFIFDSVRQKTIAQREKEAQQEKEKKEKERRQLQNQLGDAALGDLRKAASQNEVANVLSDKTKSTEIHGPHVSSEVNFEKNDSPYTIFVFMNNKHDPDLRIVQLDIDMCQELGKHIRVIYGGCGEVHCYDVSQLFNVVKEICETVRTYRHFRRNGRFVRDAQNTR